MYRTGGRDKTAGNLVCTAAGCRKGTAQGCKTCSPRWWQPSLRPIAITPSFLGARGHFPNPRLQRPQLLGVFVAGLVVGSDGSGDGRERNARGGRISSSGGLGLTGGGSVVQAHKAAVDSTSSIGLDGHIDGNLLDDRVALLSDDLDAVDVFRHHRSAELTPKP